MEGAKMTLPLVIVILCLATSVKSATSETGCPKRLYVDCDQNSDECTEDSFCNTTYPDKPLCCSYDCEGGSKTFCLASVHVSQDCTRGNETFTNGQTDIPTELGDCNTCTCTAGQLECTNNTCSTPETGCPRVSDVDCSKNSDECSDDEFCNTNYPDKPLCCSYDCEGESKAFCLAPVSVSQDCTRGNETFTNGQTDIPTELGDCNTCTCTAGQLECTNNTCSTPETGCPRVSDVDCSQNSDECSDDTFCNTNYPDKPLCCSYDCDGESKAFCLAPVPVSQDCTRGNETFTNGQTDIPTELGDCNTCTCTAGQLECTNNTCSTSETGCPRVSDVDCSQNSDECSDDAFCNTNYPDKPLCCSYDCDGESKAFCLAPVPVSQDCTRGNETLTNGQTDIPTELGDCNTCTCTAGQLECTNNTCSTPETRCPRVSDVDCSQNSDECSDDTFCNTNYPDKSLCCSYDCDGESKAFCLAQVQVSQDCTRGNETFTNGQTDIPTELGDCNTCTCTAGQLECTNNTCSTPETGCPRVSDVDCSQNSDECSDDTFCNTNYPDKPLCCSYDCDGESKAFCLAPVPVSQDCTRGNETFTNGQTDIPTELGDCNTCTCTAGQLECTNNTCSTPETGCPRVSDVDCSQNSDECSDDTFCNTNYPDKPLCCSYDCDGESKAFCLAPVPVSQDCTRGNETFTNGQTDIPTELGDCNTCTCTAGQLECTNNTCSAPETGCPRVSDVDCSQNSDECTEDSFCNTSYPEYPLCCSYDCDGESKAFCLAPVQVSQDCTSGNETFSNGETNIASPFDDCNTCNCSSGKLECTENSCSTNETKCPSLSAIDCDDPSDECTEDSFCESYYPEKPLCCSYECGEKKSFCLAPGPVNPVDGCEWNGNTYENGTTDIPKDECNTCNCTDGILKCTDNECEEPEPEPCDMKKLRECFVGLTEISVYVMSTPDKLEICSKRAVVQECVERNLRECKKDFGAIMSGVLAPYASVFRMVGDTFCQDILVDKRDTPHLQQAGQCIVDFAKVAVHGSLLATCKQAKYTVKCVQEATNNCTDRCRNIFSMVTNVMEHTLAKACKPDTCSLGMSEHCLQEAYYALSSPLYRDQPSMFTCGWMKSTIECAHSHAVSCMEQSGEGKDDERDGKPDEGRGNEDNMDEEEQPDQRPDGIEEEDDRKYQIYDYLEFIDRLKEHFDASDEPEIDLCKEPRVVGPCKARFPRWFYNSTAMQCESFYYGGCQGNKNNFETERACNARCGDEELEMEDGESDPARQLGEKLDMMREGVYQLVIKLEAKPKEEEEEEGEDEKDGPHAMFERLHTQIEVVKGKIEESMTGTDVQRNEKRLKMLLKHVEDFMGKDEDQTEVYMTEELSGKLMEAKMYLEHELEMQAKDLKGRFEHVKESIESLTSKSEMFCMDEEKKPEEVKPGFELFLVIGSLLTNPFTDTDRLCRLYERMSDEKLKEEMEIPEEMEDQIKASFITLKMIVGDICKPKEEDDEVCIPLILPEPICDGLATAQCLDTATFPQAAKDANRDEQYEEVCQTASEAMECVRYNSGACDPENEAHTAAISAGNRIELIIESLLGSVCGEPEEKCEPVPVCEPMTALDECFSPPGEFETFCVVAEKGVIPCIKEKLAACSHQVEVVLVQYKLDNFFAQYDSEGECEIDINLFSKDVPSYISQCSVQYFHTLKGSLLTQPSFNRALCVAEAEFYQCTEENEISLLRNYIMSYNDMYYEKFLEDNCGWLDDMKQDEAEDIPAHPDLTNCNLDTVVEAVAKFMVSTTSLLGIHWSTDRYAQTCSMDNYESIEQLFSTGLGSCAQPAVEFFSGGLPFLRGLRDEYCPLDPKFAEDSCSVDAVRMCFDKFGQRLAQYSPAEENCGQLEKIMECVSSFAVNCENEDDTQEILAEVKYLKSVTGTDECDLPSWCSLENEMEGENRRRRQVEDEASDELGLSEALYNLTCDPPKMCDVMVHTCFLETPEETCSDAGNVTACISEMVKDCPVALKVIAASKVKDYLSELNDTETCDLLGEDLNGLAPEALNRCTTLMSQDFNETQDVCSALNSFTQCMRSDLDNSELPSVYHGILTAQVELFTAFHSDYCIKDREVDCKAVKCRQPVCAENETETFIPEGECCEICVMPDCSAASCLSPECPDEAVYTPDGECCPQCQEEQCLEHEMIVDNLKMLVSGMAVIPFFPLASRAPMCEKGEKIFSDVKELIQSCPEDSKDMEDYHTALKLLAGLEKTMGFCSKDPMPRQCDVKQAMACTMDMAHSFLEAKKSGFKHSMCSKSIQYKMCVGSSTAGCEGKYKHIVEQTFFSIKGIVDEKCSPPPRPEPSLQCTMEPERDQGCDTAGATRCLFRLNDDIACENPDWKSICPTVPYVWTCVERHIHSCSAEKKEFIKELASKLMSRVKQHCPQTKCDVCGAKRCFDTVSEDTKDENFCRNAMKVQACVKERTEYCDKEHAADIWERVKMVSGHIEKVCMSKVHMCLEEFKQTAFSLMVYDGPIFEITMEEDESEDDESEDDESSETESIDSDSGSGKSKSKSGKSASKASKASGSKSKDSKDSKIKSSKSAKDSKSKSSKAKDSKSKSSKSKDSKSKSSKSKESNKDKSKSKDSRSSKASSEKDSYVETQLSDLSEEIEDFCEVISFENEPWWNDDYFVFLQEMLEGDRDSEEGSSGSSEGSSGSNGSGGSSEGSSGGSEGSSGSNGSGGSSEGSSGSREGSYGNSGSGGSSEGSSGSSEGSYGSNGSGGSSRKGKTLSRKGTDEASSGSYGGKDIKKKGSSRGATTGRKDYEAVFEESAQVYYDEEPESAKVLTVKQECIYQRPVPLNQDLHTLCMNLHVAFGCVEKHLFLLDKCKRDAVYTSMQAALQIASQKCKVMPRQCQFCDQASSIEDCDAKGLKQTCSSKQEHCVTTTVMDAYGEFQFINKGCSAKPACESTSTRYKKCCTGPMCNKGAPEEPKPEAPDAPLQCVYCDQSSSLEECDAAKETVTCEGDQKYCIISVVSNAKGKFRFINKGCRSDLWCQEVDNRDKKCCTTPFCNIGGIAPEPTCSIFSRTYCALNVAAGLMQTGHMDCKTLFESMNCMSTVNRGCLVNDVSRMLAAYSDRVKKSCAWTKCLAEERDCKCGGYAVYALNTVFNPYVGGETICRHVTSVYEDAMELDWDNCMEDDHYYLKTNLQLAHSRISGICLPEEEEDCNLLTCEKPDCGEDEPITPEGECCPQCPEPTQVEEKPGYCPRFEPEDTFGTCEIECEEDSDCEGEKKCCSNPCGPGHCLEAVDFKPVPCLKDVEIYKCLLSPCKTSACPDHPDAKCVDNYCGGCNAIYYDSEGNDVTDSCFSVVVDESCTAELNEGDIDVDCEENSTMRYYFNEESLSCEGFLYTGCGGNSNNYESEEACLSVCRPICSEPIEPGMCGLENSVWGFNMETMACEEFNYGGCGGNSNRFLTKAQCLLTCFGEARVEKTCLESRDELEINIEYWNKEIPALPLDVTCQFVHKEIMPVVEKILGGCHLMELKLEIMANVTDKLEYNRTVCEMVTIDLDQEEEKENATCMSVVKLNTECYVDIDPTNETQDHCGDFANVLECLQTNTGGCNLIQYDSIYAKALRINTSLTDADISCEVTFPDVMDTGLQPVKDCMDEYLEIFSGAFMDDFIPSGNLTDVCHANRQFRTCVYDIANLPVKHIVHSMVEMAEYVHDCMCEDVEEPEPVVLDEPIQCYTCHGETDNNACNEGIETCPFNKQACQTVFDVKNNVTTITKGCKNPTAADANTKICKVVGSKFMCRYECRDSLCNEELDLEEDEEPPSRRRRQTEVEEPESCKFNEFGDLAGHYLKKLLTVQFMHVDDYMEFCSSGEGVVAMIEEYKTNCSTDMTGRIDMVTACFADLSSMTCPMENMGEEPEEEEEGQEGEEEELTCDDWQMCFDPVLPLITTVGVDTDCCNIQRAIHCISSKLSMCDASQKSAITAALSLLRGVIPEDSCLDMVSSAICEVEKVEQVCDYEKANICTDEFVVNSFVTDQDICKINKSLSECIEYYTEKCSDPKNETTMPLLPDISTCPEYTTSDFDPDKCEYEHLSCELIPAIDDVITLINGDTSNCSAKSSIEQKLYGCSPLSATLVEVRLEDGSTCDLPSSYYPRDHPMKTCIQDFMRSFALDNVCGNFSSLETCLNDTAAGFDLPLVKPSLEKLKMFNERCSHPEEQIPTGGECQLDAAVNCVITKGLTWLISPYLSVSQKRDLCKQRETFISSCLGTYNSCSSEHVALVQSFFDMFKDSEMCEAPDVVECSEEPKPECDPQMAMTLVSELGISLSKCITSKSLQKDVCRSVYFIEMKIKAVIKTCPDSIQYNVMVSWNGMMELVNRICDDDKKPDIKYPDLADTPVCIPHDYVNPRGSCEPDVALQCLGALEREVFMPQGTEKRFCLMHRYTLKCFLDHTTNCDPFIGSAINPLIQGTLTYFAYRCPRTWCPVEEEPKMCNLEAAHVCLKTLQISVMSGDKESCLVAARTETCLDKALVDCGDSYFLLVAEMYSKVKLLSVKACYVEEELEIDLDDSKACILHYKDLGLELLELDPNMSIDDSESISGSKDAKTKSGSKDAKTKSGSKDAKTKSGSKDSKSKSGSKDSKSKSGSKSKSKSSQSWDSFEESSDSRESWPSLWSGYYENRIIELCSELDAAWGCVQDSLDSLTLAKRTVVSKMIKGIRDAVQEKCSPIHCYSCIGLDNEECNEQPTCACPKHEQMCYSRYIDGGYEKGCAGPEECEECQGVDSCYCCNGHKCNEYGIVEEPEICEVSMAIECAFQIVLISLESEDFEFNLIETQLQCVIEHTKGCKTEKYHLLYTVCVEIEKYFEEGSCVADYGDPVCGTAGLLVHDYIVSSPFATSVMYAVCRQYGATSAMVTRIYEGEEVCTDDQLDNLHDAFKFAEQKLEGYCVPELDPPRVCDVEKATEDCLTNRIWLVIDDNASECSLEMMAAFTQCFLDRCKGCNSAERSVLFIPVTQYLEETNGNCEGDGINITGILSAIFLKDQLTVVTDSYMLLVEHIQTSLIKGSFNFLADLCGYVAELKDTLSTLEANPLEKLYYWKNLETMLIQLDGACEETDVSEDEVALECSESQIDIFLCLDSSGSIGPVNFEFVREYAMKTINLADLESGNVRVGALQFSEDVIPLFDLQDFGTEKDSKMIQDKETLLSIIENMDYPKGRTNTGAALKKATEALKADRGDVKKMLIILTDGKSSSDDTIDRAIQAKLAGITVYAVGIKMDEEENKQEINAIATSPEKHVLHIDNFEDLEKIYGTVYVQFCREAAVSTCDFPKVVYQSCSALLYSMTSSYTSVGKTQAVCSKIETIRESVASMTASCAIYQKTAVQLIESLYISQTKETCIQFTEDVDPAPGCNVAMATMCLNDMAPFLRSSTLSDKVVCMKVTSTVECLNFYASQCEDKSEIGIEISELTNTLMNRCPDEATPLRCWATTVSPTDVEETEQGPEGTCNLVSIVTTCTMDIQWDDLLSFNPCSGLLDTAKTAFSCAFDEFVSQKCDSGLIGDLQDLFLSVDSDIYNILQAGGVCNVPNEFEYEFPADYTAGETLACEVQPVCNTTAALLCLHDIQPIGDGCRNWDEISLCIDDHIEGCSKSDIGVVKGDVFMTVTQKLLLPATCLFDFDATFTDCHLFDIEQTSACDMIQAYLDCMDNSDQRSFFAVMRQRTPEVFAPLVEQYCTGNETEEEEVDENCTVTPAEITCVNRYANKVFSSIYLTLEGKQQICNDMYEHTCFERKPSCSRAQPVGRLADAYSLLQSFIHIQEICYETPLMCSIQTAMSCITDLTTTVTRYDYLDGDSSTVCYSLKKTRECLQLTLSGCNHDEQASLIATYLDIECVAREICTTDHWELPDPDGKPMKCFDPEILSNEAVCMPVMAFECIHDFELVATNPWYKDKKAGYLAYSEMLPCVYNHLYGCAESEKNVVTTYLHMITTKYADYLKDAPTVVRSPCEEEEECDLSKATACIDLFYKNLESYREDGLVCQYIAEVEICVTAVKSMCSNTGVVEIEAMFAKMVAEADVTCTLDFFECANQYVSYVNKILEWKSCEQPETGSEVIASEDTASTEKSTKSKSEKSNKSKSEKSNKTKSEKSNKTKSEKSNKTKSEKSNKTKSEKRRRRRSEDEGSSKNTAKSASKQKSEKSSKNKSIKDSKKSPSKEKSTGSRDASESEPSDDTRLDELYRMCHVFYGAWECVQSHWSILDVNVLSVVKATFSAYHYTIMDICQGYKPGYCKQGGNRYGIDGCLTDMECNGDQKCCSLDEQAVCMKPDYLEPECCDSFRVTTTTVFTMIQSLYLDFSVDHGQKFCSMYAEFSTIIQASLTVSTCSKEYFGSLSVAWQSCILAYEQYCVFVEPPPTCDELAARACLTVYNERDAGASNSEKCTYFEELTFCLKAILSQCHGESENDSIILLSIETETKKIEESLICSEMPEVEVSHECSSAIVISEGDIPGETVSIKLTADPANLCTDTQTCEVHVTFELTQKNKNMPKCSNKKKIEQVLLGHNCDMVFTSDNWDVPQNMTLTARMDNKIDGDFKANFDISASLYIDNVKIQTTPVKKCKVLVKDTDSKSLCTSYNDPHIQTFDGLKYDMHRQGEAVFYRSTYFPYEVRVLLTKCQIGPHRASCHCGVSVRAGDDVFLINRCSGKTEVSLLLNAPLTKNFRFYKAKQGHEYTIILPHGARITVLKEKTQGLKASKGSAKLLNVILKPSVFDKGRTRGLCGIYNDDTSDDIHDVDGVPFKKFDIKDYTQDWGKAWMVDEGYQFLGLPAEPELIKLEDSCNTLESEECTCNLDDLVETCEVNTESEITYDVEVVEAITRRKRAVGDPFAALNINPAADIELAEFPTPSGITEDEARQVCTDALTGAAFKDTCDNILPPDDIDTSIENCVSDIKFVDDLQTDFIQSAVEAYSKRCEESASTDTNSTLIDELRNVTCPRQCSGQGSCNNGTCECNPGFESVDCSIDIAQQPELFELSDTNCESTIMGTCDSVTLTGEDYIPGAVCHLEIVQITETGINRTGSTVKNVPVTWISEEEVVCNLTESGSLPLHSVLISISNNGQVASQSIQHLYIAHNPICFRCTHTSSDTGECVQERASCYVNGECYRPLDVSKEDPCYICDVYSQQMIYQISENCPSRTTTVEPYMENQNAREANDSLVIGLSAGAAGLVLVIVVIVAMVLILRHLKMKSKYSDTKDLTYRGSSKRSSDDGEGFQEFVYPAFANYGYQGHPGQGYPAMYLEAPQDVFTNNIPKRHSSRRSDPTRETNDRGDRHRGEQVVDFYDNRQSSRT